MGRTVRLSGRVDSLVLVLSQGGAVGDAPSVALQHLHNVIFIRRLHARIPNVWLGDLAVRGNN